MYVTAAQAEGRRGVTHTDTMLLGNKGRARIHKKKIKQMLDKCIYIHTYIHIHRQLHMYVYFGHESFNKALQLYPKNRRKNKKAQLSGEQQQQKVWKIVAKVKK